MTKNSLPGWKVKALQDPNVSDTPREDNDGRTQVSQRRVGPKRHAPQIPDPWD